MQQQEKEIIRPTITTLQTERDIANERQITSEPRKQRISSTGTRYKQMRHANRQNITSRRE